MNDKKCVYTAMVELAERVKPQVVVLENVPGMVQTMAGLGQNMSLKTLPRLVIGWCPLFYMHQIMDFHRYGREYFLLVLEIQIKTLFSHLRQ